MDESNFACVKTAKMLFSEMYDSIYFHMIDCHIFISFFLAINSCCKIPRGANEDVSSTLSKHLKWISTPS